MEGSICSLYIFSVQHHLFNHFMPQNGLGWTFPSPALALAGIALCLGAAGKDFPHGCASFSISKLPACATCSSKTCGSVGCYMLISVAGIQGLPPPALFHHIIFPSWAGGLKSQRTDVNPCFSPLRSSLVQHSPCPCLSLIPHPCTIPHLLSDFLSPATAFAQTTSGKRSTSASTQERKMTF